MKKVKVGGGIEGLPLRYATDDSPLVVPNPQRLLLEDFGTLASDELRLLLTDGRTA